MQVEISQSFGVPPSAPFRLGEIVDVPERVAAQWVALGRAVPVALKPVKPGAATPRSTREKEINKPTETR